MNRAANVAAGLAIGVLALGVLPASPAAAHAELVEIDPAPRAHLDAPPSAVVARFNEELDADTSTIELIDASGHLVAVGAVDLDDLGRRTMTIVVPNELPDGVFGVRWQVESVADHHPVAGESTFVVGDAAGARTVAATGSARGTGGSSATSALATGVAVATIALVAMTARRARRRSRVVPELEPERDPVSSRAG